MVTGNLATEDLDSRLTAGRNKVKEGSTESRSFSTLPPRKPICSRGEGWVEIVLPGRRPHRVDSILATDLLCVLG